MPRWLAIAGLAVVGAAAGVLYGRYVAPVQYVDTTPSTLRIDYRTDYVLMVAERFEADRDVEGAKRMLAIFGGRPAVDVCEEALGFARAASYSPADLAILEHLRSALQSPASAPTNTAQ